MSEYPRLTRLAKTLLDVTTLCLAYVLAYVVRFEGWIPEAHCNVLIVSLPAVLSVKLFCLWALGIPKLAWRYVSLREAQRIFTALVLATAILVICWLTVRSAVGSNLWSEFAAIPLGVLLTDLPLSFLGLMMLKAAGRQWLERSERGRSERGRNDQRRPARIPTILIGAGHAGALVAKEIAANPHLAIDAQGFLDDDPSKAGMVIHGVPVLGSTAQIAEVAIRTGAKQALITIANTSGNRLRTIAGLCECSGISTKIIPEISEIIDGKVNLSRIRNVAIEDLLRRAPVNLDVDAIYGLVKGRTVLITGAGGSIGSELCRVVSRFGPETLVLVEKSENNLFHINWQLSESCGNVKLAPCIADIGDSARMAQILACHRPALLFHAAAHKHVPLMEENPQEAIKNNVLGTKTLADLAHAHGVGVFVMISTDKAVNPTSVMGVSKRVVELYIQSLSQRSKTSFVAVRFGNVLGSTGSVLPIFQEQIACGGPVTVTHPDMKRYFMTIPEACQLVLQAASMGKGGEIFILDMGEPVRIVDLARDLIRLSGLRPDHDIEIRYTGIRAGEKLFEELSLKNEHTEQTRHPRIFIGRLQAQNWEEINRHVVELGELAISADSERIQAKFREIVAEYQRQPHRHDPAHVPPTERPHADAVAPEHAFGAAVVSALQKPRESELSV